jgi:hypothetical protein
MRGTAAGAAAGFAIAVDSLQHFGAALCCWCCCLRVAIAGNSVSLCCTALLLLLVLLFMSYHCWEQPAVVLQCSAAAGVHVSPLL